MPRKYQWIAIVGMVVLLVCVLAALYELGRRRDDADWTPAPFGRRVLASPGPAGLPSLGPAENESMFGSRIQRTMTLLKAGAGNGRAPVKILFPLIAFIFPTVFIILFSPIGIKYLRHLFGY